MCPSFQEEHEGEGWVPYGHIDVFSIYINGNTEYDLVSFKIVQKLNQMSTFEARLYDVTRDDTNTQVNKNVLFISGNDTLVLKGRIQKVTFTTDGYASITGNGMEVKLLEKEINVKMSDSGDTLDNKRQQFTAIASNTIVEQICSTNGDGVTPWDLAPNTNTNYGNLTMRYENTNKLRAIAGTAAACIDPTTGLAFDWWVSQSDKYSNFATDYINVDTRRGSAASVKTFEVSGANQNALITERQDDMDNIANVVVMQGYGDGINQLKTSCYNSSPTYSYLSADITAAATTIGLTDASAFANSGTIIIMEEQVTYAGKSGNDLTGCTRAANSTTAYAHKKGIYVQKYVDPASPESDSSISTYGRQEKTFQDKTVIDLSTLELEATRLLMERLNPITRITLTPCEIFDIIDTVNLGDAITITDSDTGLTGTYRYVGYTLEMTEDGELSLSMEVNNVYIQLLEQLEQLKKSSETENIVMQGATNIDSISETDNMANEASPTGNPAPGALDLYMAIPADAVAINKVLLSYRLEKPKTWASNSSSTTTNDGVGFNRGIFMAEGLAYWSYYLPLSFDTSRVVDNTSHLSVNGTGHVTTYVGADTPYWVYDYDTDAYTWGSPIAQNLIVPAVTAGTFNHTEVWVTIYNGSGADRDYAWEIRQNSSGGTLLDSDTETIANGATARFQALTTTTDYTGGSTFYFKHNQTFNAMAQPDMSYMTIEIYTYSNQAHTHSITYGLAAQAYSASDIRIFTTDDASGAPTWTERTAAIETALGRALNSTENSSELDIDLAAYFSSTGWKAIRIVANGNCRCKAQVTTKVFVQSR